MTDVVQLGALVRAFLDAEASASNAPCLHRYRGAVRTREIARRKRVLAERRAALEAAVGWDFKVWANARR